jgi:hypothetical protein
MPNRNGRPSARPLVPARQWRRSCRRSDGLAPTLHGLPAKSVREPAVFAWFRGFRKNLVGGEAARLVSSALETPPMPPPPSFSGDAAIRDGLCDQGLVDQGLVDRGLVDQGVLDLRNCLVRADTLRCLIQHDCRLYPLPDFLHARRDDGGGILRMTKFQVHATTDKMLFQHGTAPTGSCDGNQGRYWTVFRMPRN